MMVAKFTPGPWHANWTRLNGKAIGFHVADETHGSIRPICEFYDGTEAMPPEEVEANARLIAAAPAMLEALQGLTHGLPELLESIGYTDEEGLIDEALAVIAQATGGEDGR